MKPIRLIAALLLIMAVAGCGEDKLAALPAPREPGPDAIGTVCRMSLSEHSGPKGQVFVGRQDAPLWFSSVRDTFSWLLVDDGAGRKLAAIYVNDMARAGNWDKPSAGAWVEARKAHFVVGSDMGTDMGGGAELVPFSNRADAESFAGRHGGTVVEFAQITPEVLAEGVHHANRGHHE